MQNCSLAFGKLYILPAHFGYVKTLQMEYACRLLKECKPVEEVAYTWGYEYAQHFSTSFKNFSESSPSGWGR